MGAANVPGLTLATWNTNFRTPDRVRYAQVGLVLDKSEVAVLTEAGDPIVKRAVTEAGWDGVMAEGSSELVAWNPAVFRRRRKGPEGVREVHGPGPSKYLPGREVSWLTLEHKGSGTSHLVIASHVTAGYAAHPDKRFDKWRTEAARRHLLALVALTAELVAAHPGVEFHHLAGDLNAGPDKRQEWWYPSRVLDSLYRPDPRAGLDWLAHTRASAANGLRVRRRWTEPLGSEGFHPAHYKRVSVPRMG